jgi:hypothetical protein
MPCPYIEGVDERCAHMLTLRNIQAAVSLCAYDHLNCPIYQKLKAGPQASRADLLTTHHMRLPRMPVSSSISASSAHLPRIPSAPMSAM